MARKKSETVRLGEDEPCPCESGNYYGECCWNKKFEFHRDAKGIIFKTIPVHPQLKETLELQLKEFKSIFGRIPVGGDPVIFDKYFYSPGDFDEQFREAAKAADIPSELIYASQKTGFIVGEETWDMLTPAEQQEWNSAIEEYFDLEQGNMDHPSEEVAKLFTLLRSDIFASICHIGAFLERAPRSKFGERDFLQYYFAARTLDTIRTIYRWLDRRYSDDIWMLLRIVYESYLRLAYIRCSVEAPNFFFALAGTASGTHQYAKTDKGRTNYRSIIELATGRTTKNVSNREMISSTGSALEVEIYEALYAFLSSYSHMGLDKGLSYFDERASFLLHKDDDPFLALQWAAIILATWVKEVSQIQKVEKQTARDLRYMANRLNDHIVSLLNLSDASKQSDLIGLIRKRFGC